MRKRTLLSSVAAVVLICGAPAAMAQSNNDHKDNARQELNQAQAGQHESKGHQSKTQKENGTPPSQASGSQNEHAVGKNAKAPASQAKPSTTGQAAHDESSIRSRSTKANESAGKAASKDYNSSSNRPKSTSSKQSQHNNKAAQAPNASTTGKQTQDENSANHNAASQQNTGTASNSVQPSTGSGNKVQVQGANLSIEQQTKVSHVSRSIISRNDAPRIGNPDFSISVGTVIPTHVHFVRVPETLVTVYPQWRDDDYFIVRDEIVIVDHSRRIVAVIPAGSERASSESTTVVDLSPAETREVQTVLIERGYLHGQADGEWGPRTRDALISFQRKEGVKATGRVDQRTVQSLGLSGKIKTGSIRNGNENAGSQNAANGHEPSGSQASRNARPAPENTGSAKANTTTGSGKPGEASASKSGTRNSTTGQSPATAAPANATEHKGSREQTTGQGLPSKEKRKHRDETTGAK